jgi:hypothetical protein
MNTEALKRLIEKYYSGNSTEEEEKTIQEYFNTNDIPEGYEAEKAIFGYYRSPGMVPGPSDDFEARIMAGIDSSDRKIGPWKNRKFILPYISAAAGLLILAGSYFFFINRDKNEDTFRDPAIAYAETIKILRDVSSQLNHGVQTLEPIGKMNRMTLKSFEAINNSTLIIEKNMKNFNFIQKAVESAEEPVYKKIIK